MTLKAFEMLHVLFSKLSQFEADSLYVSTLYAAMNLLNRIGYNSMIDSIPLQSVSYSNSDFFIAVSKAPKNKLSECDDALLNILWPSIWDESNATIDDEK